MDALISDLLRTTSYALDSQRSDATGMRASLQILHRRLLDAAQDAARGTAAQDAEVFAAGVGRVRVTSG